MIPAFPSLSVTAGAGADIVDLVLLAVVGGTVLLALAVDLAVLLGWLKRKP